MESLIENATSENLTAEDWTLIIGICEQVEGSAAKARDAILNIIKRLNHKNVNVVLYSLTLANALVQNCNLSLKIEVASRPFLSTLQKLLSNPKTHPAVKNRTLDLIQSWAELFRGESQLDFMGEIYHELVSEGYTFPSQLPPTPKKTALSDKDKEDEELQLAVALSLSEAKKNRPLAAKSGPQKTVNILFKVRALYDFNPSENGELKLQKGQIIDVTDNSTFADWWKGTSNGETGIFPSNYVSKIEDGRVIHRSIPDENAEILQHMKIINDLKAAIMKADHLGHNSLENERLQKDYQKAVELVPLILKKANAQRKKQDRLASLHERFSTAVATYQGIMNSYALQRQQQQTLHFGHQGTQQYSHYSRQQF